MERGLSRLSKEVRVSGRCREKKQLVLLVAQLFDPLVCPWDSPGKYTGVGCHSLLQGILLNSGGSPALQADSSPSAPPRKLWVKADPQQEGVSFVS